MRLLDATYGNANFDASLAAVDPGARRDVVRRFAAPRATDRRNAEGTEIDNKARVTKRSMEDGMYIGLGTVVLILVIVLIIYFVRRA
jgi:hypothetical protein